MLLLLSLLFRAVRSSLGYVDMVALSQFCAPKRRRFLQLEQIHVPRGGGGETNPTSVRPSPANAAPLPSLDSSKSKLRLLGSCGGGGGDGDGDDRPFDFVISSTYRRPDHISTVCVRGFTRCRCGAGPDRARGSALSRPSSTSWADMYVCMYRAQSRAEHKLALHGYQ